MARPLDASHWLHSKKNDKRPVVEPDRRLISLAVPSEIREWCRSLGCTEAELKAAVNKIGHSASKVRDALSKNREAPQVAALTGLKR